MYSSDDIDAWL